MTAEARTAIRRNGAAIRSAPNEQYRPVDTVLEASGARHVRFERTHAGLPVLGGDFVVHTSAAGRFSGATVAQSQVIDVPITAKIGRQKAISVASGGKARKVIDAFDGKPVLAWEVTSGGKVVIVDATTGAIRRTWDEVHHADEGRGHGLHAGQVPLGTTRQADGTYRLVDPARGGTTVRDAQNRNYSHLAPKEFGEFTDADNVWGDGTRGDRATAAVDVHYGLAKTWDYLKETFGRSGVGNDGKGLTAYVHHGIDWANASWSRACGCMYFGDGTPAGRPFTTVDLVAHETAHGLVQHTANLVSSGESGGLNEATGDIFGTLVEFWVNNPADAPDYLVGEGTGARDPALRRMDEPDRDGKSASCWSPTVKDLDVHHSAGIGNKFFYNLAVGSGDSQWGDSTPCNGAAPVTGIGNDRAAQIWYRALNIYMVSNTDFAGARDATMLAAADLYGPDSAERRAVNAAWLAAGVDGSTGAFGAPQLDNFGDSMPSPRLGETVRIQVSAREPQGQPMTFSAINLPPGVTIDANGLITGAPTTRGDYPSNIIVTDPDGNTDRELMWWVVKGPPVIQSAPAAMNMQLGAGALGNYSVTVNDMSDHMADPYNSLKVTVTGVPDGLTVSVRQPATGTYVASISGIPTTEGSGTTLVTVTDADGETVTATIPWQVLPANRPSAPVGVSAAGGNGTAKLVWERRGKTGETPVTGWIVRVTPGTETTLPATARSLELTKLDIRRAYTIGVRATSALGDSAELTTTLTPTALPLTASPIAVSSGKPATLSGRILRGGRTAVTNTAVVLEQRPAGKTTWSYVLSTRTDAKGVWRAAVKPSTTTAYRVRYTGSAGMWPATSAAAAVTVRYTVTLKANKTKTKVKLSGTAKPGRSGVKVTLQRKAGTRWVTVTTGKTVAGGAYSFTRTFKRGTWTLRVVVAGSAYNATVTSAAIKLKVK
ncbi:M4 family metallopeptidase [Actinoplanes sp. NBC_00393]|uniref:M4 family metallopeptidase n=1 Tax=Actinoplanes sp. NBC_00393 TaxID=2975953 RepID=UPI002E1A4B9E